MNFSTLAEDEDEDDDEKVIPKTASSGRGQKFSLCDNMHCGKGRFGAFVVGSNKLLYLEFVETEYKLY